MSENDPRFRLNYYTLEQLQDELMCKKHGLKQTARFVLLEDLEKAHVVAKFLRDGGGQDGNLPA